MKVVWFMLLLLLGVEANQHPYKQKILLEQIEKPTLVRIALDNEIYSKSQPNYVDLRLKSSQGEEGYFLRGFQKKYYSNQKHFSPTSYDREHATLTFTFDQPFDVEKITLQIEDRNFESLVDVFVDNRLLVKEYKIFDYSSETGTQNFSIPISKTNAKEIKILYHLDKTTSFYKKYRHLQELSKYLSIKSATFSNSNRSEEIRFEKYSITLKKFSIKEKKSSYLFQTDNIPFSRLELEPLEQNFKRTGIIYGSDDGTHWRYLKTFSILSSTMSNEYQKSIGLEQRSKYIKLEMEDKDNKPLTINKLTLLSMPKYFYFLAKPHEQYTLYYGQKGLKKPQYELESLVSEKTAFIEGQWGKLEVLKVDIKEEKKETIPFLEAHKESIFILIILFALGVMGYIAFGLLRKQ